MKYIAFIFSIYFILLAILPCQDREDMIASVIHVSVQKSNSCSRQGSQETCPPFCTCSCCSTARQLTATITTAIHTQQIVSEYPDYGIPAIQKQAIKIWQPPQIG